ncbi:MAG: FAD-dependent thymidylate synthase [Prochlorotrichaceae cyanobacterium]|jgi:thymidylate synthase (FAD)
MNQFAVAVLSQMPNPQTVIYAAMHQDYSEGWIWDEHDRWPDEAKCGEIVVKRLLAGERGHYGPLEHPQIVFNVGYFPHSVMQQARTHRVGTSFDVQCLAGDTEVTFVQASGSLKKIKIADLYDRWTNGEQATRERKIRGRNGEAPGYYRRDCKTRLRKMRLRVLNEQTGYFQIGHIKAVMCSGVQPVYRLHLEDGKTLDCTTKHRLLTTQGWQPMGEALGLISNAEYQVLAVTKPCQVMCNGIVRYDSLYTQKNWLSAQVEKGLNAREIAGLCGTSPNVIRNWAKRYQLRLPSGRRKGLKSVVGQGLYRDKAWLQKCLAEGLHADEMATLAGCSIESIKKWVYAYKLPLNRRLPGTDTPWNKGKRGYKLNLSEESRRKRQENASKYTQRGSASNFWKGGTSTERQLISAWTRQIAPQIHQKFEYRCQRCGLYGGELHAHHLIPVYADESLAYQMDNLVTLCRGCHEFIHQNHLEEEFAQQFQPLKPPAEWKPKPRPSVHKLAAHPVTVTRVEYLGLQTTYDLEVDGDWHNFVANGIVVHNSMRYTGQRIAKAATGEIPIEDVFYLRPAGEYMDRFGKKYLYSEEQRQQDLAWCEEAAKRYKLNLEQGMAEEHARGVLPFDYRQHFVVSFNVRSLMHFLDLRAKKDAQLEIQKLCDLMWPHFQAWVPEIAEWYEKSRLGKARLSP